MTISLPDNETVTVSFASISAVGSSVIVAVPVPYPVNISAFRTFDKSIVKFSSASKK